jgi:AAT family amino acid transporter
MAQNKLSRGLSSRHISMIAIGGAIGTGLFVATGSVVSQAGPGGAILAYLIIGIMLYFLMSSIGELATIYPVSGSFSSYSARFVDSSLGFTVGWLYWVIWVMVASVDIIIASSVLSYWDVFHFFSSVTWSIIFLVILFLLNIFSVKAFGEAEFWLSLIKVLTIIIFIIVGVLTIVGILGGKTYGISNYSVGEAPFVGGISGFLGVLLIAGFSVGGTEVVAVTAGESDNPHRSMPKAIKQVFWRILLFYVLSIAVIAAIIPYTDPLLLNKSESANQSPFTIVFHRVGIAFAASVINAVILTSLLSAANSGLYTSSRMLFAMGQDKQAPKFLSSLNKGTKLPVPAILTTFVIVFAIIMLAQIQSNIVFTLLNIIGSLVIFVWGSSILAQVRLRKAIKKQNKDPDEVLPYKAPFYPVGPIIVIVALLFLFLGNTIGALLAGDIASLLRNIIPVVVLAIVYLVHKFMFKTKVVKLENIDLTNKY